MTCLRTLFLLTAVILCCCCGGGEPPEPEVTARVETQPVESVDLPDSNALPYRQVTNTQHCADIINITEVPEWVDDPMLIEALDDGRIMVVGYSTSDSIAEFSSDLTSFHGFTIEGGQGTLTALRSDGNSLYALRILILTEFDSRTGRNLGVRGNYDRCSTHDFDYFSDMFLVVSPGNNEVSLNWLNSSGEVLQTVDDPLRMNSDDSPGIWIPTAVAMDSNRNGWVSNGINGTICVYRMTGQLLNTCEENQVPNYMRRFEDKMFIGTGDSFGLYDNRGNRLLGGMLPENCIDADFTADGKLVALTVHGEVILMDLPCLYNPPVE